jgi:sigma-B regulation protein RsbU (phosphoserine phosphatase)
MSTAPGGHILVVDDSELNRDVLSRRLLREGHVTVLAEDGEHAMRLLSEHAFDIVLLDIMMPGLNGYEVLERIKRDERLRHLPVIMISAVDEIASVIRCIELGAEDYLPKPFDPVLLRARVAASLERKRLRDVERAYAAALEREMTIGRRIQGDFFPESLPEIAGWELAAHFEPARQVAGDFYDAFRVSLASGGDHIALVVGDVCDKGVGAALFMGLFRTLLRVAIVEGAAAGRAPDDLVVHAVATTNDYIARTHGRANMFCTLVCALLDSRGATVTYVNAGHDSPVIVRAGGGVRARLTRTGPAVGMFPDTPFAVSRECVAAGEALLIYTDGLVDARDANGVALGEEAALRALEVPGHSAAHLLHRLTDLAAAHAVAGPPYDDITLLALRRQ